MDLTPRSKRKPDTTISVYAEAELRDRVARVAHTAGVSISQLVRTLVEYGLPEAERQLAARSASIR